MSDKKYENYFDEEKDFQMPLPLKKKSIDQVEQLPEQVEQFGSLEELNAKYGDYEYQTVDMEIMNVLANENMLVDEPEEMDQKLLEENYIEDPFDYNTLYKLIYIYRETGQTEKLEEMRNHTSNYFPLADHMWIEWIKDKKKAITNGEGQIQLLNFMKKAFSDFYYPKICIKFLKLMIKLKGHSEEYSIENIRKYFDEFLKIWSMDFNNSTGLYDLYMSFELANLAEASADQISYMTKHIRSIYKRRLSYPHIDLDIIWNEYKKWETDQNELAVIEIKYKEVFNR
jgi:hypothetical protein